MNKNQPSNNSEDDEKKTGVIYVINKFKVKNKNQPFRCVMIYQDKDSGFCFIKPLLYKIELELVMELFQMFTTYGPPLRVHVNSCSQDMVTNIATSMKVLCDFWDIEFIKKNVDSNDIVMLVITKLHEWMERFKKDQWELGCSMIQWEINTTKIKKTDNKTPYELFFSSEVSDKDQWVTVNIPKDTALQTKLVTTQVKVERVDSDELETCDNFEKDSLKLIKLDMK